MPGPVASPAVQRARVLELDVPSRPEYIAIVRLVVASVASLRRAMVDERIDDLKLAVSEACTNAIEANRLVNPGASVHIEIWEEPDRLEITIDDLIGEGDRLCARATTRGTHRGAIFGIPPTGKAVTMTGLTMVRIAEGRLAESWVRNDVLGLRSQLGAVSAKN